MIKSLKRYIFFIFFFTINILWAQSITMDFPKLGGKTYELYMFKAGRQIKILADKIPQSGRFVLEVPKSEAPYKGILLWLISNDKEGGGLELLVNGSDYSVSSNVEKPSKDSDIIYNSNEILEFKRMYGNQQKFLSRLMILQKGMDVYSAEDKVYDFFRTELELQTRNYIDFSGKLEQNNSFAAQYLNIVNLSKGISVQGKSEKQLANYISSLMKHLDLKFLYHSGYWNIAIQAWIYQYNDVLSIFDFNQDFEILSKRLTSAEMYREFMKVVSEYLTEIGRDDLIHSIAPSVIASGKISSYDDKLAAFLKGGTGTVAPDLETNSGRFRLNEFNANGYYQTLLLFYDSGCGPCENLLNQIPGNYNFLKSKGVRIVSVSADRDEKTFKSKAMNFPWKDFYCDYKGFNGSNFKNYGVFGTPTMFLIDSKGKIILRTASLAELLKVVLTSGLRKQYLI